MEKEKGKIIIREKWKKVFLHGDEKRNGDWGIWFSKRCVV